MSVFISAAAGVNSSLKEGVNDDEELGSLSACFDNKEDCGMKRR